MVDASGDEGRVAVSSGGGANTGAAVGHSLRTLPGVRPRRAGKSRVHGCSSAGRKKNGRARLPRLMVSAHLDLAPLQSPAAPHVPGMPDGRPDPARHEAGRRTGRPLPLGRKKQKRSLTSRQEARRRRIASNVKPFIATLRVTNPVRKSWASSRKRVLRGGG